MKIKKVEVGGFKNIENVKIDFKNILAIVSQNNYGKSNLLDALEFGIDFIKETPQAKEKMMSILAFKPINKNMKNEEFKFLIEIEFLDYYIEYSYSFKWRNDDKITNIVKEKLRVKENKKGQKYSTFFSRQYDDATYKSAKTGRNSKRIKISNNNLLINKLVMYDELYYNDLLKEVLNIKLYINRSFDAGDSFESSPFKIKGLDVLDIFGEKSIPPKLYKIKKEYPERYELIKNIFMKLFPNITDIIVQEILNENKLKWNLPEDGPVIIRDEMYLMLVKDKNINEALQFTQLSEGAKRIFLFLTYVVIANINNVNILAIEELENSIHPGLFYKFINILSEIASEEFCIILSSHSPYIIQYMNFDEIYVGMPNEKGLAKFSKIKKTNTQKIYKLLEIYDMSIGDYIFEKMNGDENDIKELLSFMEE